jgi:hypothetical protein
LLGQKASDHTILPGWFRNDAPFYHKIGSSGLRIFNRQGEAPAFDVDRVEYGHYTATKESGDIYEQANEAVRKNEELAETYKKLVSEGNIPAAEAIQKQAKENEAAYSDLMYRANAAVAWWRVTVLPTQVVTVILNNALSLVKAKEYQGFLGKLDALLKDVRWQLMVGMVLAGIAALAGILIFWKMGGINF